MPTRLTIRLDFDSAAGSGAGKIACSRSIAQRRSHFRRGPRAPMSYRRAWLLVDDLKHLFGRRW